MGKKSKRNTSRKNLRALGLALGVLHVPVARAFILVPICPRWNTVAFLTANSTVLQAPIFYSCLWAPHLTLWVTETCHTWNHKLIIINIKYIIWEFFVCSLALFYIPEPAIDTSKKEELRTRETSKNVTKTSFIFFPKQSFVYRQISPKNQSINIASVFLSELAIERARRGLFI